MNGSGQLLFFLALMALASLIDAMQRRARRLRMEEMGRREAEGSDEDRAILERGVEEQTWEEQGPPPFVVAAEELRESGRQVVAPPVPSVVGALAGSPRSQSTVPVGAQRLRAAFRGDPAALRRAVLYREILGEPLGSRRRPGGLEEVG